MSDENLSVIHKFETEIEEDGSIKIPKEELKSLREKGFGKINVVVLGSSGKAVQYKGYDESLFRKIKEVQVLPDDVVLGFLNVKGKLSGSEFEKRAGL